MINIKIELPKRVKVSNVTREKIEKDLLIKKLNKYGFFNEFGKWKEK